MILTDLQIQKHIEQNCRNEQGGQMMDEQTFFEGAKWYRDNTNNYDSKRSFKVEGS